MKSTSNYSPRTYNPLVIARLVEKHGFTKKYIQQCLRGDRKCVTADTIIKDYKELDKAVAQALKD